MTPDSTPIEHHHIVHGIFLLATLATDAMAVALMNSYIIWGGCILTTCGIIHYAWLFFKWVIRNFGSKKAKKRFTDTNHIDKFSKN